MPLYGIGERSDTASRIAVPDLSHAPLSSSSMFTEPSNSSAVRRFPVPFLSVSRGVLGSIPGTGSRPTSDVLDSTFHALLRLLGHVPDESSRWGVTVGHA